MDERLTIKAHDVETGIEFYWTKRWADITLKSHTEDASKFMFAVTPEILRTIADQFYIWADTLEETAQPGPDTKPVKRQGG